MAGTLRAENAHELVRTLEAIDLHQFDQMMALAALERDESRFGYLMGHYRSDYPDRDDPHWKGVATVVSHDRGLSKVERHVFRRMSRVLLKFSGGHYWFRLLPDRTVRVSQRLV